MNFTNFVKEGNHTGIEHVWALVLNYLGKWYSKIDRRTDKHISSWGGKTSSSSR
jgi:hypothetical protein